MAPDADMPDDKAQRESCDLASAVPQAPRLNRGIWGRIEARVRRLTPFHGDVFVVTAPGFSGAPAAIGRFWCPMDLEGDLRAGNRRARGVGVLERARDRLRRGTDCGGRAAVQGQVFPSETLAWAEEAPAVL